jgi:hypothetical protein
MKKEIKKINIALSPGHLKKLEEGNYNKNKLILSLLEKYLLKKENFIVQ